MTDLPDAALDAPVGTGDRGIVVETDDASDVHAASTRLGETTTDELLEGLLDEHPLSPDAIAELMKGSSHLAKRAEALSKAQRAAQARENSLGTEIVIKDQRIADLETRVAELEQNDAAKDQRIADLEARNTELELRDATKDQRIADLEARNAELTEQAMTDLLTGLPNRRAIEAHMDRLLGRREKATGLIVFDLNTFKYVNDTYGHSAGDTTLRTVAEAMTRVLRKSDVGARLGGDEFAVAVDLNGQMDPDDQDETMRKVAFRVADAVRTRLDSLVNSDDFDRESDLYRQITASFGFAVSDGAETRESLGERADRAMYKAKTNGGQVRIVNARELS